MESDHARSAYTVPRPAAAVLAVLVASGVAVAQGSGRPSDSASETSVLVSDSIAVYGPRIFDISEDSSALHVEGFSVSTAPGLQYVLRVENGASGGGSAVDSATVVLNGNVVFDTTDISDTIPVVFRNVEPVGRDTVEVTLWGDSASFARVTLLQQPDSTLEAA